MTISPKDALYERFTASFARHERALRGYVRSLLPSVQDADDVMQEVALSCWRKYEQFDGSAGPDAFVRWACVVARFEVLRFRRNCARDRLVLCENVMESLAQEAAARLEQAEIERVAVEHCLGKLPPAERRLLLSVHTQGDSVARMAAELGIQVRRLYRKVNSLRDLLADCVSRRLCEGEH